MKTSHPTTDDRRETAVRVFWLVESLALLIVFLFALGVLPGSDGRGVRMVAHRCSPASHLRCGSSGVMSPLRAYWLLSAITAIVVVAWLVRIWA